MPLAKIEKLFMEHLLRPQANETEFLEKILPLKSLSGEKQLSIYIDNINGAHQKVLSQIYPACRNVLGEDYFDQLCRFYRVEYPSLNSDLNKYGEDFSMFLNKQFKSHNELSGLEYLPELAWLEWKWHETYYADDDSSFSFELLSSVEITEQDKIVFSLSYSFSLFITKYPLFEIWNANKGIVNDKQEFLLPENEECFCLVRENYISKIEVVSKQEYMLLCRIEKGLPLVSLIQTNENGSSNEIQSLLMSFIKKGWVTKFLIET